MYHEDMLVRSGHDDTISSLSSLMWGVWSTCDAWEEGGGATILCNVAICGQFSLDFWVKMCHTSCRVHGRADNKENTMATTDDGRMRCDWCWTVFPMNLDASPEEKREARRAHMRVMGGDICYLCDDQFREHYARQMLLAGHEAARADRINRIK